MSNMSIYHNRQVASTILFVLMLFCWFGCSTDEDDAVPAYKIIPITTGMCRLFGLIMVKHILSTKLLQLRQQTLPTAVCAPT